MAAGVRYRTFGAAPGSGNETVVHLLSTWPGDAVLARMAVLSGCHETTFLRRCGGGEGGVELRWFARHIEVPLCGHGGLAAAHFLRHEIAEGAALAVVNKPGRLWLSKHRAAPAIVLSKVTITAISLDLPGAHFPCKAFAAGRDYLFHTQDGEGFRHFDAIDADLRALDKIGVILAAPSYLSDLKFRFFAPRAGIAEDPASASVIAALLALVEVPGKTSYLFTQGRDERVRIHAEATGDRVVVWGTVTATDQPGVNE